jgi:outer membrane protein OmpA-like peptidoglycan-associated protein
MKIIQILICTFFLLFKIAVLAQNLVANGSFEEHEALRCLDCYTPQIYPTVLKGWHYPEWYSPYICDKKYDIYQHNICNFNKYSAKEGATHIELVLLNYRQTDTKGYFGGCNETGYSNYLERKLVAPLAVGKTYSISASFYVIQSVSHPFLPNYAKYIGIDVDEKSLVARNSPCTRSSLTPFLLDTILTDIWVEKKWFITPTKPLNYVQIGIFLGEDKNPDIFMDGRYGVDKISIQEVVDSNEYKNKKVFKYPFPNIIKTQNTATIPHKVENIIIDDYCYFETNSYELDKIQRNKLDSICILLKKNNFQNIIDIIGHTDSVGSEKSNKSLSEKRAQIVYNYLLGKGIPFYCLNNAYLGASKPLLSNDSENGRRINRRVQIKKSEYGLSEQFYYHASQYALSNNIDSAFYFLNKWHKDENSLNKTVVFFDPDLDAMKKDKRWIYFYQDIKSSFKKFKNPSYAFLLDSLKNADQLYRTFIFKDEKKYTPEKFDTLTNEETEKRRNNIDKINFLFLKQLLSKYGYPKISEVGKKAAEAAFLIIDHADLKTMKSFLPKLEQAYKEKEAEGKWYATMYDRILIYEGKPQKYGTQYVLSLIEPDTFVLGALENSDKVNEYRQEMGLSSLNEKDRQAKIKFKKNKK